MDWSLCCTKLCHCHDSNHTVPALYMYYAVQRAMHGSDAKCVLLSAWHTTTHWHLHAASSGATQFVFVNEPAFSFSCYILFRCFAVCVMLLSLLLHCLHSYHAIFTFLHTRFVLQSAVERGHRDTTVIADTFKSDRFHHAQCKQTHSHTLSIQLCVLCTLHTDANSHVRSCDRMDCYVMC